MAKINSDDVKHYLVIIAAIVTAEVILMACRRFKGWGNA